MPNLELLWDRPLHSWQLNKADVHVWAASLNQTAENISIFKQLLSLDELSRAEKFAFDRDRHRFVVGRGILRSVLGSYLKAEPAHLRFTYTPRGKPSLDNTSEHPPLYFNVAHSENLLLIAVTSTGPLGVDIEWIHPVNDAENIAEQFFSDREVADFKTLPEDGRTTAFFNLWTRKEACLKATGDGISEMVKQIEVAFMPGEPSRVLAISGNSQMAANWTLKELIPAPGFIGAVALAAKDIHLSCWQWPA